MSDSEVVWNIRYTETAKNDLKGIVSYIKNVLLEEMIAQNMYSAITSAIYHQRGLRSRTCEDRRRACAVRQSCSEGHKAL